MKKSIFGFTAILAAVVLSGCGSTSNVSSANTKANMSESGMTIAANKTYLRDWTARSLGGEARPDWLAPAFLGDFSAYKAKFGLGDEYVVKVSTATGADVRGAQMRTDINYARMVAKELQQSVNNYAAERSRTGAIDKATCDAIEEVTQAQSSAEITGHEKRTEFYHIVDEEDAATGKMTRKVVLYQVYVIPAQTWARTTATYLKKVLGDLPEEQTVDEKFVSGLVGQMMEDARHPTVMTQKQKEQELEYSGKMLQAQVDLEPQKQKDAAQQALVKIVEDGKTERTKTVANAKTEQVKSLAEAQTMAALTGNPAVSSAATVTPADKDWLEAQNLAMSLLF